MTDQQREAVRTPSALALQHAYGDLISRISNRAYDRDRLRKEVKNAEDKLEIERRKLAVEESEIAKLNKACAELSQSHEKLTGVSIYSVLSER